MYMRHNVLFLVADDLRPELGAYGGSALTPNLDKLANSTTFQRAYTCSKQSAAPHEPAFCSAVGQIRLESGT